MIEHFQQVCFYLRIRLIYLEAKGIYLTRLSGSIPRIDFISFNSTTNDFPPISQTIILTTRTTPLQTARPCRMDPLAASLSYCSANKSISESFLCDFESTYIFKWKSKSSGDFWSHLSICVKVLLKTKKVPLGYSKGRLQD